MCIKHFRRVQAHGDPNVVLTDRGKPLVDRFSNRIRIDLESGCWIWTAGTNGRGYGRFAIAHDKVVAAHRWSYEHFVGPIPDGFTIDHVKDRGCTSTLCCNPDHLEAVPLQINLLRGETLPARNAAKTHCPAGHPYEGDNLRRAKNGARICRICANRRQREYLARRATR
jgi:hypothetical protein